MSDYLIYSENQSKRRCFILIKFFETPFLMAEKSVLKQKLSVYLDRKRIYKIFIE